MYADKLFNSQLKSKREGALKERRKKKKQTNLADKVLVSEGIYCTCCLGSHESFYQPSDRLAKLLHHEGADTPSVALDNIGSGEMKCLTILSI